MPGKARPRPDGVLSDAYYAHERGRAIAALGCTAQLLDEHDGHAVIDSGDLAALLWLIHDKLRACERGSKPV